MTKVGERGGGGREKGRKGDIKIRRAQENVGSGIIFMHTFLPMERTDRGGERISRDDFFEDGPLASCLNSREKQTKCWDAYYKVTVQKSKVEKEREDVYDLGSERNRGVEESFIL